MPDQTRTPAPDLQVVSSPPSLRVVLGGLPPVYAQGLSLVLQGSGAICTVVQDLTQLPVLLAGPHPLVVVVPAVGVAALPLPPAAARHAVVVVLETATPEACAGALHAGVTGVLTPGDALDDVLAVLQCAGRGQTVLRRELVQALCRPTIEAAPSLTAVEQAWLRSLAAGGTVAGLARSCGYSEREMYRRLSTVYLRIGARTRTEALLLAERFGLLDNRV